MKVGDTVRYVGRAIEGRTGTIVEINHKWVWPIGVQFEGINGLCPCDASELKVVE